MLKIANDRVRGPRSGSRIPIGALLLGVLSVAGCESLRRNGSPERADQAVEPSMVVKRTADFEVTGDGSNSNWKGTEWVALRKRDPDGLPYDTRVKALYSETGIYFLMDGTDERITATMSEDFLDLWNEDVFEVFLWTDERYPIYFEYEISPLGYELPILVPNFEGEFLGWRPWHYEKERLTRKATSRIHGPKESGASMIGWMAEVFIPYALLRPLQNVPPPAGTRWRANFYRVDYDGGRHTSWDWAPVGPSFHEFRSFGTLLFE